MRSPNQTLVGRWMLPRQVRTMSHARPRQAASTASSISAPGLFANPEVFTELYRRPIESGADPTALERLRRRVRPLMLRRTKELVAQDLPPKQEQVLPVALGPRHRKIYDTHLAKERQRILGLVDDFEANRIVRPG